VKQRIILINNTVYEDAEVLPLLKQAMLRAECEPPVVVILQHLPLYTEGFAYQGKQFKYAGKLIDTNGGWIVIKIPTPKRLKIKAQQCDNNQSVDVTYSAVMFFEFAVHEFKHIADFQTKRFFSPVSTPYRKKEEEIRARITETLALLEIRTGKNIKALAAIKVFAKALKKKIALYDRSK